MDGREAWRLEGWDPHSWLNVHGGISQNKQDQVKKMGELCFWGRWPPNLQKVHVTLQIESKTQWKYGNWVEGYHSSVFSKIPFVDFEKKNKYFWKILLFNLIFLKNTFM